MYVYVLTFNFYGLLIVGVDLKFKAAKKYKDFIRLSVRLKMLNNYSYLQLSQNIKVVFKYNLYFLYLYFFYIYTQDYIFKVKKFLNI